MHNVSSLIICLFFQGQLHMHQPRNYFAVNGDFVPLETLRIRHCRCVGTTEVTVMEHENETKPPCRVDKTYLAPQNP